MEEEKIPLQLLKAAEMYKALIKLASFHQMFRNYHRHSIVCT
jgi:hypothetical protein